LNISGDLFRRITNFEFYNLSETKAAIRVAHAGRDSTPFLTLKRAERNFLKFLAMVTNGSNSTDIHGNIRRLEPGCPLSDMAVELRKYTYAVQVPFPTLLSEDADIEEMELGADAFEILVDPADSITPSSGLAVEGIDPEKAAHISKSVSKVRRSAITPVIFHVVPSEQNGNSPYLDHVRHGLSLAPDYLTIDLSLDVNIINQIMSCRGSTKIIGHLQSFQGWEDPFWAEKYGMARTLGCVAVRFMKPASSLTDNSAVLIFKNKMGTSSESLPLGAFSTGRMGRTSACFNTVLTTVVPESRKAKPDFAEDAEKNSYLPLVTARDATKALYASFILDPMQFYIIGANTGYSLSPAMYRAGYEAFGMPHSFKTMQTPTLNGLKALVNDHNFGGSAITLPFKVEVISLIHSLGRHAKAIGAVNTLIPVRHLKDDGSIPNDLKLIHDRNQAGPVKVLYGENTDWIGIQACIRRGLSPANAVRPNTSGLVIGAGGMARAAVYAMLQSNVMNIAIFNRTLSNAEKLVAHFKRVISSSSDTGLLPSYSSQGQQPVFRILQSINERWPQEFRHPTIIVSCIPPHPVDGPKPEFTLPTDWMKSPTGGVVIELEYRTLETPLMRQIRAEAHRAWIYLDGLDLLPEQGFAQFELFTGRRAPRRLMREAVLKSWTDERGRSDPDMLRRRLETMRGDEA
jgi:shikimate 5-dehydrogenase